MGQLGQRKIGGALSFDGVNDYVEVSSRKWTNRTFQLAFLPKNQVEWQLFSLGMGHRINEITSWILKKVQGFLFINAAGN